MKKFLIFVLIASFVLSACNTSHEIEVHGAWARFAPKGSTSAIYMIIHNHSDIEDELTGITTDVATTIEIHQSSIDTNGVMQMEMQSSVRIPAGEEIEFAPGSLHIMLIDLTKDINVGDEITVTLHFKTRADITITVPVTDGEGMREHSH